MDDSVVLKILSVTEELEVSGAMDGVLDEISNQPGAIFASGYEYPGRYSRWDFGFVNPPVEIIGKGRDFIIRGRNQVGELLLDVFDQALENHPHLESFGRAGREARGRVVPMPKHFPEEARSRQPTIFSVLRCLLKALAADKTGLLGFYGAFGYDLVFQFEPIALRHKRDNTPDLHLFLPDEVVVIDHRKEEAWRYSYAFGDGLKLSRQAEIKQANSVRADVIGATCDHQSGEFADKVRRIIKGTRAGDFFEVVLSQEFSAPYAGAARELFEKIRKRNPSPYEFFINLGTEQLIGASPEMFVRVEAGRVETCPISGTIRRGGDAVEDAEQALTLLNSGKDRAELTMCTDVDRNDKSRVCVPGTVVILERRGIERYSKLFHTVDHVAGQLRPDCDGLDALLSHMWACTLTGAPKSAAMQTIENMENSPRCWYGGCVGMLRSDGTVNTGITIRTVRLRAGRASVRAGATLLYDSVPEEEEAETRLKAEAFLDAILNGPAKPQSADFSGIDQGGEGKRVLLIDNRDSFVHTLGNYFRQTGAKVTTMRAPLIIEEIQKFRPHLVVISPGPGRPIDFAAPQTIKDCVAAGLPVFGVCLGLQGMVEAFGGELGILPEPVHGRAGKIKCEPLGILAGFPQEFIAGRYHSLFALPDKLPDCLQVLAKSEDGVIMAIQHNEYPAAAVQFHPESLLTLKGGLGIKLIANAVAQLAL